MRPEHKAGSSPYSTEFSPYAMLSVVASLTPYSDFNQSPRNMYQCQMAKQTMGFPIHATEHRADNKTYRLHTPQTPLARTRRYCGEHSHIAMISCLRK